jgi:hypothetical protein
MECWNTGFGGMRSIIISIALIRNLNQEIIRFLRPLFHFPTIPLFHELTKCKHHPFGVKSKPNPPG